MKVAGVRLVGAVMSDVDVRHQPDTAAAVVPVAAESVVLAVPDTLVRPVVEQVNVGL